MIGLRWGTVSAIGERLDGLVRLEVDDAPCIAYPRLTGDVEVGDVVLVNEQAKQLGLGSGGFDVLYANLTRGLRLPVEEGALISVPAGIERMPVGIFLLLTTVGSLIWNTIFVMLGYTLGENWPRIEPYASTFQKIVIGAVILGVCTFVVYRVRSIRASR